MQLKKKKKNSTRLNELANKKKPQQAVTVSTSLRIEDQLKRQAVRAV